MVCTLLGTIHDELTRLNTRTHRLPGWPYGGCLPHVLKKCCREQAAVPLEKGGRWPFGETPKPDWALALTQRRHYIPISESKSRYQKGGTEETSRKRRAGRLC